jgi:hypothetical protein
VTPNMRATNSFGGQKNVFDSSSEGFAKHPLGSGKKQRNSMKISTIVNFQYYVKHLQCHFNPSHFEIIFYQSSKK